MAAGVAAGVAAEPEQCAATAAGQSLSRNSRMPPPGVQASRSLPQASQVASSATAAQLVAQFLSMYFALLTHSLLLAHVAHEPCKSGAGFAAGSGEAGGGEAGGGDGSLGAVDGEGTLSAAAAAGVAAGVAAAAAASAAGGVAAGTASAAGGSSTLSRRRPVDATPLALPVLCFMSFSALLTTSACALDRCAVLTACRCASSPCVCICLCHGKTCSAMWLPSALSWYRCG